MIKTTNLVLLLGLISIGVLAAYEFDYIVGGSRYKQWVFDAGESVDCASTLSNNGTLITGNYHRVLALHGTTGTEKWGFAPQNGSENLAAAPAVGPDGAVYVPSEREGKPYRVIALDGKTGKPRWAIERQAVVLAPGDERTLYLGYLLVSAVDEAAGKRRWTFNPTSKADGDTGRRSDDGRVEAMTADHRTVYVVFGCPTDTLYALDTRTGWRKWSVSLARLRPSCDVPASLAITEEGTPVVSLIGASLGAYEARTGRVLWRLPSLGGHGSAQLQVGPGSRLYAGTDNGTLWALDTRSGAKVWERGLGARISHPPVVSPDGVVCVGTNANRVYALNAANGKIEWSVPFGWLGRDLIPGYGEDVSLAASPTGTVYAASSDGRIYALHSP